MICLYNLCDRLHPIFLFEMLTSLVLYEFLIICGNRLQVMQLAKEKTYKSSKNYIEFFLSHFMFIFFLEMIKWWVEVRQGLYEVDA